MTLNIAFNYGGRAEIVDAVRRLVADRVAGRQDRREGDPRAPVPPRHARPGPRHAHLGGVPDLELLAVGAGLLPSSSSPTCSGRTSAARTSSTPSSSTSAAPALRGARHVSVHRAVVVVAARSSCVLSSGAGRSTASPRSCATAPRPSPSTPGRARSRRATGCSDRLDRRHAAQSRADVHGPPTTSRRRDGPSATRRWCCAPTGSGESDRICVLLDARPRQGARGRQGRAQHDVAARGAPRAPEPRRRRCSWQGRSELVIVHQAEPLDRFRAVRDDLAGCPRRSSLLEVADQLAPRAPSPTPVLSRCCVGALLALGRPDATRRSSPAAFFLKTLALDGAGPGPRRCASCGEPTERRARRLRPQPRAASVPACRRGPPAVSPDALALLRRDPGRRPRRRAAPGHAAAGAGEVAALATEAMRRTSGGAFAHASRSVAAPASSRRDRAAATPFGVYVHVPFCRTAATTAPSPPTPTATT